MVESTTNDALNGNNMNPNYNYDAAAQQDDQRQELRIAREFVRQYYTMLSIQPEFVHRFYSHDSLFMHNSDRSIKGQEHIRRALQQMNFNNCRVKIHSIKCCETSEKGLLIQVVGELANNNARVGRRFLQSIVLCKQGPKKFYALNDIFCYADDMCAQSQGGDQDVSSEIGADTNEMFQIGGAAPTVPFTTPSSVIDSTMSNLQLNGTASTHELSTTTDVIGRGEPASTPTRPTPPHQPQTSAGSQHVLSSDAAPFVPNSTVSPSGAASPLGVTSTAPLPQRVPAMPGVGGVSPQQQPQQQPIAQQQQQQSPQQPSTAAPADQQQQSPAAAATNTNVPPTNATNTNTTSAATGGVVSGNSPSSATNVNVNTTNINTTQMPPPPLNAPTGDQSSPSPGGRDVAVPSAPTPADAALINVPVVEEGPKTWAQRVGSGSSAPAYNAPAPAQTMSKPPSAQQRPVNDDVMSDTQPQSDGAPNGNGSPYMNSQRMEETKQSCPWSGQMKTNAFIKSIPVADGKTMPDTENELKKAFSEIGCNVRDVRPRFDKTDARRAFAFVDFNSAADADVVFNKCFMLHTGVGRHRWHVRVPMWGQQCDILVDEQKPDSAKPRGYMGGPGGPPRMAQAAAGGQGGSPGGQYGRTGGGQALGGAAASFGGSQSQGQAYRGGRGSGPGPRAYGNAPRGGQGGPGSGQRASSVSQQSQS